MTQSYNDLHDILGQKVTALEQVGTHSYAIQLERGTVLFIATVEVTAQGPRPKIIIDYGLFPGTERARA